MTCRHINTSRAWRGNNGQDYVVCLDCTRTLPARIQFGNGYPDTPELHTPLWKAAAYCVAYLCILAPAIYWFFS